MYSSHRILISIPFCWTRSNGLKLWIFLLCVNTHVKKKSLWCLCFAYFCFILISGTAFSLGVDLQVCTSKTPTCCTKKMEERYQIAAKQDIQQVLQTSSAVLKFLISRNAAAFQGKTFCFLFPNLFILFLIFIFDYLWCNKSYLLIFSFSLCFYAFK